MRRDFLDAGRTLAELEFWALDWKAHIGELYHLNQQRLAQWQPERPLSEQNAAFGQAQQALQAALDNLKELAGLIGDVFQLMPSGKHMVGRVLGCLEPTVSLQC